MKMMIRVMKALSDPGRVKIVKLLESRELCVCELRELLGLAQSTVSKHLKILEEAGLVDFRKEGAWIIYRLSDSCESSYSRTILETLRGWLNDDPQLQYLLDRLPQIDRCWINAA